MHFPTEPWGSILNGQKCVNINKKKGINLLFYKHIRNMVCRRANVVKRHLKYHHRWWSNMSTSRVLEELKRICSAMRSLTCFMPRTSWTYVPPAVVRPGESRPSAQSVWGSLTAELVFAQVMKKAHVARQRLLRLGIFKEVEVLIDTSEGTGRRWGPGCDCSSAGFDS